MKMESRTGAYTAAILCIAIFLTWKLHGGVHVAVADPSVTPEVREHLRNHPAVPDLDVKIERILAASEEGQKEMPEDNSGDGAESVPWGKRPKYTKSLVQMLRDSPETARLCNLLRHPDLNPPDKPIEDAVWRDAAITLDPMFERLVKLYGMEQATGRDEMSAIVASGLVEGVSLRQTQNGDVVTTTLPDDYWRKKQPVWGVHFTGDGRGFSFAIKELPQTLGILQMREALSADYLAQVSEFFVRQRLIDSYRSSALVEEFFVKSHTLR